MRTVSFRVWVERAGDAVALARPTLLIPLWTMHLMGALRAADWPRFWSPDAEFLLLSGSHTLLAAAAHILNQIADMESDKENGKLFLLADGLAPLRFAYAEMCVLAAAAVGLALLRGAFDVPFCLLMLSGAMGAAYSAAPFRLKCRAGWDLLSNSVGYGCVAFALTGYGGLGSEIWLASAPYVLSVGAVFLFTAVVDMEGDGVVGCRTSAVALGCRRSALLGAALMLCACGLGFWAGDLPVGVAAAIASPLYLRSAVRVWRGGFDRQMTRASQWAILALSGAAVFHAPWYALVLGLTVLWARVYYAWRFGMRYP